jgi:NodT family efflux transporter outer membrane factor (OMF) lipoprotein
MGIKYYSIGTICILLYACTIGPKYVKPTVEIPSTYKEAPKGWKIAHPRDTEEHGSWWKMFTDQKLNHLETILNKKNLSIKQAEAQYQAALALVKEANTAFFPTIEVTAADTRQKQSIPNSLVSNTYNLGLNASWEPDLWGIVRRSVEASSAGAESSAAALAATRLAMQASLAQLYFQLRILDLNQRSLNNIVIAYEQSLQIIKNQYQQGVAARLNILQAETAFLTAKTNAVDNGILRAQYEHSIAVLIGQVPAKFSIKPLFSKIVTPAIPKSVPSSLLERRPDIAQAERLVAQANANIGVAMGAFFPAITLSATSGFQNSSLSQWITSPARFWSLGSQVAETLFDGGLNSAKVEAAKANYDQTVANYRQIVLQAFQNVEDGLVSVSHLKQEELAQQQVVDKAKQALTITLNEYKAGTIAYLNVLTAQNTLYTAEQTAATVRGRLLVSTVSLITALGGGYNK